MESCIWSHLDQTRREIQPVIVRVHAFVHPQTTTLRFRVANSEASQPQPLWSCPWGSTFESQRIIFYEKWCVFILVGIGVARSVVSRLELTEIPAI